MLAPEPFFESRGTPISVLGRLRALSTLGHEVDLVTYHLGENVSIPGVTIHRIPRVPLVRSIKVGPSLIKPFLDVLLFAKAIRLLRRAHYDLLHTHEEAGFLGVLLARLFHVRHVYDMHSSLPQQLTNFRFTRFRPLLRLFERMEQRVIEASDAVITICPALEEHVSRINGAVPQMMIENVPSEPAATPSEQELAAFRADHPALDGNEIVLYTGTFEPYQGLDLLIESAPEVMRRRDDVLFLMVGGKPEQVRHYRDQVDRLGLSAHFHFTGLRPASEMPLFVEASRVLASPRTSGTNTPLKIYGYLRTGKPIVATDLYTHTQVLSRDVAVLVEPTPSAFAEGILAVLQDDALAAEIGSRARLLYETRYSFESFVQKTEQALELACREDTTR